jgi:hypothetical protein
MGKGEINPNLGLVCKPLPDGGPHIIMVKSIPGVFRDMNGEIVSDEMAGSAGFDVAKLQREAAKETAKSEALAAVEAKFAKESAAIDGMSDEELGIDNPPASSPEASGEDTAPFVQRNSANEPRACRLVEGGPVRVMEYVNADKGWKVFDRDSGEVFGKALDKAEAEELLVGEI